MLERGVRGGCARAMADLAEGEDDDGVVVALHDHPDQLEDVGLLAVRAARRQARRAAAALAAAARPGLGHGLAAAGRRKQPLVVQAWHNPRAKAGATSRFPAATTIRPYGTRRGLLAGATGAELGAQPGRCACVPGVGLGEHSHGLLEVVVAEHAPLVHHHVQPVAAWRDGGQAASAQRHVSSGTVPRPPGPNMQESKARGARRSPTVAKPITHISLARPLLHG
jgi:hypothetical protein